MFSWLKTRRDLKHKAENIYASVVSQARRPEFYRELTVPDTLEGRYEMIALHMFLAHEHLRMQDAGTSELARTLTERFVTDMDDSMRETGIGDTSVPKKVKRAAAGLLERVTDYRTAAREGPANLATAIDRHVYEVDTTAEPSRQSRALADYAAACINRFAAQPPGRLEFADIAAFANAGAAT